MENFNKDPLDGYPQTVSEKIRRKILLSLGIFPGILGNANEANGGKLTGAKAATIKGAEKATGKKLNWQVKKQGD